MIYSDISLGPVSAAGEIKKNESLYHSVLWVSFSPRSRKPVSLDGLRLLWGQCWVFWGDREAGRAFWGGAGAEAAQVCVLSSDLGVEETSVHKTDKRSCTCGAHIRWRLRMMVSMMRREPPG